MAKAAIVIFVVQQKILKICMCWPWILYSCSANVLNYDVHMATDTNICAKKFWKLNWLKEHYVSLKSKLQHRHLAYPGRSLPLSSRWGRNLSLHGGGEFWFPCTGGWGIWTEPSIWFRFGGFLFLFWVLLHATRFHFSLFYATNSKAIYHVARKLYNFLKQSE